MEKGCALEDCFYVCQAATTGKLISGQKRISVIFSRDQGLCILLHSIMMMRNTIDGEYELDDDTYDDYDDIYDGYDDNVDDLCVISL